MRQAISLSAATCAGMNVVASHVCKFLASPRRLTADSEGAPSLRSRGMAARRAHADRIA